METQEKYIFTLYRDHEIYIYKIFSLASKRPNSPKKTKPNYKEDKNKHLENKIEKIRRRKTQYTANSRTILFSLC